MFVTDKLVFLELHKTGGTHIGKMLSQLTNGRHEGKHNRLPARYSDRFILGSVRNPWDWYVSLWAYGCSGQGSIYHCTTEGVNWSYYWHQLPREMGKKNPSIGELFSQINADFWRRSAQWSHVYSDHNNADHFRKWLKLILDYQHRLDIREGFGFSPISKHSGLLTYRYIKLFTNLEEQLYKNKALATYSSLNELWQQHSLVDCIIRNENLETDLIAALEQAGITVSEESSQQLINAKNAKVNRSKRREAAYYYDQESIDLVHQKERFIIDQHQYIPPQT